MSVIRGRQKDQQFKVILCYILSSRPARVVQDTVSKKPKKQNKTRRKPETQRQKEKEKSALLGTSASSVSPRPSPKPGPWSTALPHSPSPLRARYYGRTLTTAARSGWCRPRSCWGQAKAPEPRSRPRYCRSPVPPLRLQLFPPPEAPPRDAFTEVPALVSGQRREGSGSACLLRDLATGACVERAA